MQKAALLHHCEAQLSQIENIMVKIVTIKIDIYVYIQAPHEQLPSCRQSSIQ